MAPAHLQYTATLRHHSGNNLRFLVITNGACLAAERNRVLLYESWILAYLDPATGSLVIQALIAGLVSIGFVFRRVLFGPWRFLFGHRASTGDASTVAEDHSTSS